MRFTYYTIIGKDAGMIRGHLHNIKHHAGFDALDCEKELIVIVYTNPSIPKSVTKEILGICEANDATAVIYPEPTTVFLDNLYACWNLGYEKAKSGWVFRAGSDQAFNKDNFPKLYDLANRTRTIHPQVILQANTIEHSIRAMANGNVSRHILANFGDTFDNFDIEAFETFCSQLNQGLDKELLTIGDSVGRWGKPTPFHSTLGWINRTEGCSWLMTREDWERHGPMPAMREGITGDCWITDQLQKAGYPDFMVRDCITYHFFRGESIQRYGG